MVEEEDMALEAEADTALEEEADMVSEVQEEADMASEGEVGWALVVEAAGAVDMAMSVLEEEESAELVPEAV